MCLRGESPTHHTGINLDAYDQSPTSHNAVDALKAARIAAGQKPNQGISSAPPQAIHALSLVPSKAELLGYTTAGFIFVFGVLGTLFSDGPDIGGIRRTMAGAYMVGAVHVVLLSSIAGNTFRQKQ